MKFYENILERAREKEYKLGIKYAQKDGKLYNFLKVFYIIGFAFANAMNLMYILAMLVTASENPSFSNNLGSVIAVSVLVAIMFGALILSKFNQNPVIASIFGGVNVATSVGLLLIYMNLMTDDTVVGGISVNFYWRHLAPLTISALCAVGMALVVVIAYFKTKKSYNKVLEIVYDEYNVLPQEERPQWEEFVSNYNFKL